MAENKPQQKIVIPTQQGSGDTQPTNTEKVFQLRGTQQDGRTVVFNENTEVKKITKSQD